MAARRLLKDTHYGIYIGACIALMPVIYHFAKSNDYNKLLIGIFVGAILVNLFAATWEFTRPGVIPDDSWKFLVFKTIFYITFFLCPYAAVSELIPKKFAWYLVAVFALICVITTLFICYEKLKASLNMTTDDEALPTTNAATARIAAEEEDQALPTTDAATARIAAEVEEEQNVGGSGSSATDPAASQEQPNLNGSITIVTQN